MGAGPVRGLPSRRLRRLADGIERGIGLPRIIEFDFRIPIVAHSNGTVVDGHLRLKAARRLGLESVPVALADDLTPSQIRAFRLLANRSATWAEFDEELLALAA